MSGTSIGGVLLGAAVIAIWFAGNALGLAKTGVALGITGISVAAIALPGLRRWLPERGLQVSRGGLARRSRAKAAFSWGVELGIGARTFVVTPGFYAFVILTIIQEHPLVAGLLCVLYGASRGMAIAAFTLLERSKSSKEEGWEVGFGIERRLRVPLMIAILVAAVSSI